MRIRAKYKHWLPLLFKAEAVTVYPWIFFRQVKKKVSLIVIQHEFIHVRQVRELGFLRMTFQYAWEYFAGILRYRDLDKAYRNVSFEKEAYRNETKRRLTQEEKEELKL